MIALLAVPALALASTACAGTQQPLGDAAEQRAAARTPEPQEAEGVAGAGKAEARAGDGATARTGGARASTGDAGGSGVGTAEGGWADEERPRALTLKVLGDPGTAFTGVCSVGGREEVVRGRVPERYAYELRGGKLACEIRKEAGGALQVVFSGEGVHSVQQTNARGGAIRFVFSGGGLSSSTSSVSQNQVFESSERHPLDDAP